MGSEVQIVIPPAAKEPRRVESRRRGEKGGGAGEREIKSAGRERLRPRGRTTNKVRPQTARNCRRAQMVSPGAPTDAYKIIPRYRLPPILRRDETRELRVAFNAATGSHDFSRTGRS